MLLLVTVLPGKKIFFELGIFVSFAPLYAMRRPDAMENSGHALQADYN